MKNKKAISPVVATALLLIVAVVAVVGFQGWFTTFSSSTFANIEQQTKGNDNIIIDTIIGNSLYLRSNTNTNLSVLKIIDSTGSTMCQIGDYVDQSKLFNSWNMDAKNSTDAFDSINNYNCKLTGNTKFYPGFIGTGVYFDGSSDMNCGDINELEGINNLTISAWVKWNGTINGLNTRANILGKENAISFRSIDSGHKIFLHLNIGGNWYDSGASTTDIDDGNWHHIVGSYDNSNIRIYMDGVQENSNPRSGTITVSGTDQDFTIGGIIGIQYWTGIIDDVKIFNYKLSDEEILEMYESGNKLPLNNGMNEIDVSNCNLIQDEKYNILAISNNNVIDKFIINK